MPPLLLDYGMRAAKLEGLRILGQRAGASADRANLRSTQHNFFEKMPASELVVRTTISIDSDVMMKANVGCGRWGSKSSVICLLLLEKDQRDGGPLVVVMKPERPKRNA